ncbi:hypothetical protein LIER_05160 [Lithospermum erythrorhizon]|uniref:Uncharacterized protein n=1 Tax=Lithospermum erythrorhizon TaxID=34254 RepID=A0AAV3P016_LITER
MFRRTSTKESRTDRNGEMFQLEMGNVGSFLDGINFSVAINSATIAAAATIADVVSGCYDGPCCSVSFHAG